MAAGAVERCAGQARGGEAPGGEGGAGAAAGAQMSLAAYLLILWASVRLGRVATDWAEYSRHPYPGGTRIVLGALWEIALPVALAAWGGVFR